MNLSWTQILLLICIGIETFHVCGRDYVLSITTPVTKRHQWSQAYENLVTGVMNLSEYMHDNPELSKHLDIEALIEILKITRTIGGPKTFRHNIMDELSGRHLLTFLGLQALEVIYWIIAFVLACSLPHGAGAIMFIVLLVLSTINDKNNKAKNPIKYWYLADALICNTMYIALICMK